MKYIEDQSGAAIIEYAFITSTAVLIMAALIQLAAPNTFGSFIDSIIDAFLIRPSGSIKDIVGVAVELSRY